MSKLPELVEETKKDLAGIGLKTTIVGHVGDGNFHALLLFKSDEERERAHQAVKRMVKRAIALDGTCKSGYSPQPTGCAKVVHEGTGEHGVGIGKKEYLVEELGEGTVQLMKTIKKTLDPLNLFNPGKVCYFLCASSPGPAKNFSAIPGRREGRRQAEAVRLRRPQQSIDTLIPAVKITYHSTILEYH